MDKTKKPTCAICGNELDPSEYVKPDIYNLCDHCWYGMRLNTAGWKREMKRRGIKVRRTVFPVAGKGFRICGDLYEKAEPQEVEA